VEGATSISTILLVDVDVGSSPSYIYVPTPWAKHTKTTVWGAPSLGNPSCSKLDFSHPSLVVAVVVAIAIYYLAAVCKPLTSFASSNIRCRPIELYVIDLLLIARALCP